MFESNVHFSTCIKKMLKGVEQYTQWKQSKFLEIQWIKTVRYVIGNFLKKL